MTDDEIMRGLESKPEFVVMIDHTNTEPTGGAQAQQYLNGKKHLVDELIRSNPNSQFFLDHYRFNVDDCDNVTWLPMTFMWPATMMNKHTTIPTDWQHKRSHTVNHLGGRTRINRILMEHWLAKNYPSNQLIYTKAEESSLDMIKPVLESSEYATKRHIAPRRTLPVEWNSAVVTSQPAPPRIFEIVAGEDDESLYWEHHAVTRSTHEDKIYIEQDNSFPARRFQTGIDVLIPQYKLKSYLALQTEPQDITLNTVIGEKTWDSIAGGNLVIQFGNYRATELMQQLGLETFSDCFDMDHLSSLDRYYQTIGGLENNRSLITSHEAIETIWHERLPQIRHNFRLATDINHWFEKYREPLKQLTHALAQPTNLPTLFWCHHVVDRYRHEFKL